jgi:hypothetical protein
MSLCYCYSLPPLPIRLRTAHHTQSYLPRGRLQEPKPVVNAIGQAAAAVSASSKKQRVRQRCGAARVRLSPVTPRTQRQVLLGDYQHLLFMYM